VIEGRPSETALAVAAFRAAHRADHLPVIFDDPLAGDLTSEEWRARLAVPGAVAAMIDDLGLLPIQGQVVGRARYLDEQLEAAVADGIAQYVLLGAGLDSFAWRRPDLAGRLRVIELDHPTTQHYKRQRLTELGIGVPEGVELAAVDLECTSVGAALAGTSFDPERPAFFSWMGVVVYLTRAAFEATLADVAAATVPGSRFLFDYPVPPALLRDEDLAFSRSIAEGSAGLGESRKLKLLPEEVAAAARAAGFEAVEDLSPDDHFARYFAGRPDALTPCPEVHLVLLRRGDPE
jgi:methyltransferase (TIGR00027 family)